MEKEPRGVKDQTTSSSPSKRDKCILASKDLIESLLRRIVCLKIMKIPFVSTPNNFHNEMSIIHLRNLLPDRPFTRSIIKPKVYQTSSDSELNMRSNVMLYLHHSSAC
ncbi:hypothetical protein ACH5RR_037068 [Cinchona calisaya]|uniref:Uncharacterized protein n=1 Tax=Cinchona calisaya TaxID=153742 RepID=A0ABD2Y531_9GENT